MRLNQSNDKAERLLVIPRHEVANSIELVFARGIANAVGIKSTYIFKRECRGWLDVHLAGDADAVTE